MDNETLISAEPPFSAMTGLSLDIEASGSDVCEKGEKLVKKGEKIRR